MAKQFTLGKQERLKSRKVIEQVFSEGSKFNLAPLRVYYLLLPGAGGSIGNLKMGVGVSTKLFKKAVDRNRIKRLVKEAWRLQKDPLREMIAADKQLAVFLVYTSGEIAAYSLIRDKITKVIQKLSYLVSEIK